MTAVADKPRILIIDDDRAFRVGTGALLADEGYEVDAEPGGDPGLERLRRERYDMVLLDLKMQGRTGLSVLEELRGSGNDVPVLMLMGFATVDSAVLVQRARNSGCANRARRFGRGAFKLISTTRSVIALTSSTAPSVSFNGFLLRFASCLRRTRAIC